MKDEEKRAHDFAISILQDYLQKHDLKFTINGIDKLLTNDSKLFAVYYVSYYGFLRSLKHQHKVNLKDRISQLADKLHLK